MSADDTGYSEDEVAREGEPTRLLETASNDQTRCVDYAQIDA